MVNNFKQISDLLKFDTEDDFYYCQILKRKKEHAELGRNSVVVKTYYIKNIEDYSRYAPEIMMLCEHHNARAYINLNKRSFEKIAFHTLKKVSDILLNRDYSSMRNAYNSVCGSYSNENEKKWIIDIDFPKPYVLATSLIDIMKPLQILEEIKMILEKCMPLGVSKIITVIPSKNGVHLITKPFNIHDFKIFGPDIIVDIHKDNPTNLYIP